jgi:hypothetical protein
LAHSQQTFSKLGAALLLPGDRGRCGRDGDQVGAHANENIIRAGLNLKIWNK